MKTGDLLASVDLGSNSFRLLVARFAENGTFTPIDQIKETVRLASGLDKNKELSGPVVDNALQVLSRFGERLVGVNHQNIRVVATSTLREAKNAKDFIVQGSKLLKFAIEVISGTEEARLVYIGAMHSLPYSEDLRIVIDIGGGSTEFIVGNGYQPKVMESITMGCVSFANKFFKAGVLNSENFDRAVLHARVKIQTKKYLFPDVANISSIGTSGSAKTLFDLCRELGFGNGITYDGMLAIRDKLIEFGNVDKIKFDSIKEDRKAVLASGLSIMLAIFKEFHLEKMNIADGALREGVLYDLIGRFDNHDLRETTIKSMLNKYEIDLAQAEKVRRFANYLYQSIVPHTIDINEYKLFNWAAELSEIGLAISHSNHQKHGAYILENADLAGFSKLEQKFMSELVGAHRGYYAKIIKKLYDNSIFFNDNFLYMLVALRLSVMFNRSRLSNDHKNIIKVRSIANKHIEIICDSYWLKQNKLTKFSLEEEVKEMQNLGLVVDYKTI